MHHKSAMKDRANSARHLKISMEYCRVNTADKRNKMKKLRLPVYSLSFDFYRLCTRSARIALRIARITTSTSAKIANYHAADTTEAQLLHQMIEQVLAITCPVWIEKKKISHIFQRCCVEKSASIFSIGSKTWNEKQDNGEKCAEKQGGNKGKIRVNIKSVQNIWQHLGKNGKYAKRKIEQLLSKKAYLLLLYSLV